MALRLNLNQQILCIQLIPIGNCGRIFQEEEEEYRKWERERERGRGVDRGRCAELHAWILMTGLDPKRNKQRQHQRQRTCPSNKEIFNVVAVVVAVAAVVVAVAAVVVAAAFECLVG